MPKFHSEREYMLKTIVLELYFWGSLAMELLEGHLKSASLPACSNLFFLSFYTVSFIYDGVSLFSCLIADNS